MGLQWHTRLTKSFVIGLLRERSSGYVIWAPEVGQIGALWFFFFAGSHLLSRHSTDAIQRSPTTPTMRNDSFVNPTNNCEASVKQMILWSSEIDAIVSFRRKVEYLRLLSTTPLQPKHFDNKTHDAWCMAAFEGGNDASGGVFISTILSVWSFL